MLLLGWLLNLISLTASARGSGHTFHPSLLTLNIPSALHRARVSQTGVDQRNPSCPFLELVLCPHPQEACGFDRVTGLLLT